MRGGGGHAGEAQHDVLCRYRVSRSDEGVLYDRMI